VFFKGCPLRCVWCANPESQERYSQFAHMDVRCNNCKECVPACSRHAIAVDGQVIHVDRTQCNNCGECVGACPPGALKLFGEETSLERVVDIVKRDLSFYRSTGGGVTVSGGEPLEQSEFVKELFEECKEMGIHTCLDTCGYGSPKALENILEYTDLVYYDLKLIDGARHRAVTGVNNDLILSNLRKTAEKRVDLVIRVPLVPGINSAPQDIQAIVSVVAALPGGQEREIDLLPYHRFGANKYPMLDRLYQLLDLQTLRASGPEVQQAKELIERAGLKCRIVV
jgi:pyruvate formate lyase activating enzyme